MKFLLHDRSAANPLGYDIYLEEDSWDDFGFKTKYRVGLTRGGKGHNLGSIKIGSSIFGASKRTRDFIEGDHFTQLPEGTFSIGDSEGYYKALYEIGIDFAREYLTSVNDVCFNPQYLEQYRGTDVFNTSFMRSITESDLKRFVRLADNDQRKISYKIDYRFDGCNDEVISFSVDPNSIISTNMHAIIGSNGVGKTSFFADLVQVVSGYKSEFGGDLFFSSEDIAQSGASEFNKIVFVSFSVFDQEEIARKIAIANSPGKSNKKGLKAVFVGLIDVGQSSEDQLLEEVEEEVELLRIARRSDLFYSLLASTKKCLQIENISRWRDTIGLLQSDPIFSEFNFEALTEEGDITTRLREIFDRCSSGHSIVLLLITRLIEVVEERTLILFDEPESHLHPPLLSSLLVALSKVVRERNGVAIVATHSPVVLQEIPKKCVWVLNRDKDGSYARRPEIETLGENVGVLTREVFDLQMRKTGFNSLIRSLADDGFDKPMIIEALGGSIGSEARALISTLTKRSVK